MAALGLRRRGDEGWDSTVFTADRIYRQVEPAACRRDARDARSNQAPPTVADAAGIVMVLITMLQPAGYSTFPSPSQ
jgi:hypothetical protein